MKSDRRSISKGGFTLIELLVVIGIVLLLISILIPVVQRTRRRAVALVTPVAYASESGAVYALNPNGSWTLDIAKRETLCWNSRTQGPAWSPNGSWLGFTIHDESTGTLKHWIAIANVSTGEVKRYLSSNGQYIDRFLGWADDSHFIEFSSMGPTGTFLLRDANLGHAQDSYSPVGWRFSGDQQITIVPSSSNFRYVTITSAIADGNAIVLLRKVSHLAG